MHRLDIIFGTALLLPAAGVPRRTIRLPSMAGICGLCAVARFNWEVRSLPGAVFREHQTLVNSYFFYDVFIAVGPTAAMVRDFRVFKKQWQLDGQLIIPLLVLGARPAYSGLESIPFTPTTFPT
ncbi:MAG: hypothetical protein IPL49_21980 [Saprospirales bacterium]|nr:hypothetical protein [Saprospirales bacterium]